MGPTALSRVNNFIKAEIDKLLVSLNVYCDVYAIPCKPTVDRKGYARTNYIDQHQWDQLFGLGGHDGRTIIDLRDDLVALRFWLGKPNNARLYPYVAGTLADGIKESDWLHLISTMKQRDAVYKQLKDNVGFTTFWDRMTEIAKSNPKYRDVMVNAECSNYGVFGNSAFQMINSMRDNGLLELCDDLHGKVFGLPNTNKGVASGLEP